ncbi:hypothetical protein [Methylobacterium sp. Leaf125]|uniref:hypothetical protein n=1 Tax=Methylobacterium sp. Leaf125 TaxID=1736265 RepID=UPI0012E1E72B|nr:hypothetical protein [Methylobacterium sp. Leaf125]
MIDLGWRGDGPIRTDVHIRGPWEFELLKAAGIEFLMTPGTIRPASAVPRLKSRWSAAGALDHSIVTMPASQPLTSTIVGYFRCYSGKIEPGDDLSALCERLAVAYSAARTADGEA